MKKTIIVFIIFLLNISPIYAACTGAEIKNFKETEDKYIVEYKKNPSTKSYDVYLNRPEKEKYDYRFNKKIDTSCQEIDNKTIKCTSFLAGKYEISIVGVTQTCNSVLKKINLEIPQYVSYSEDPLCEGIEEFVLCNPNYDKDIDYETFVSRVNTYKKNLLSNKEEEKKEEEEPETPLEENIINYLKEYWLEITIVIVFIILVIITTIITAKSIRKSRRLE